jgi:NADH-quinone oxidoreductase subunit M
MDFLNTHLLSLILFLPTIAALIMLFLPSGETKLLRWFALSASLIPFVLTLVLWTNFDPNVTGFQFEEKYVWYEAINSSFHLGVDGISLSMVLLTTLLTPLAILASFSVTDRVKPYMMLFLFLETGMLGVFMALDLLIFFVFWEIGLVPMYFLINQWGSANRDYASLKFMIYTMGGSLGLLLAVQCSAFFSGPMTWLPFTSVGIRWMLVLSCWACQFTRSRR